MSPQSHRSATVVTWSSLPRKDQLFILFLCRFVDFLQVASLQTYVFYQLKSFDAAASEARVSTQAGILQGCFTAAQVLTAVLWGKAADQGWCGRKLVLIIGLFGTAVSCMGYGFCTTFAWAAFWRACGGGINGTVGIIRTMIAEITVEKKYQSRAFLILPFSFNVAGILGPIMGGWLVNPVDSFPSLFGQDKLLGFAWLEVYPYALPSIANAIFLMVSGVAVVLFLEETSDRSRKFDIGLHLGAKLKQILLPRHFLLQYSRISTSETIELPPSPGEASFTDEPKYSEKPLSARRLPFRRIWTRNVILTFVSEAFYDFQLGAFANLWSLFLSTPRRNSSPAMSTPISLPWVFTGGLGMLPSTVGVASSFLGILGTFMQVFIYPPIQARLGTLKSFQWFLALFPIAYFFTPYLGLLAEGACVWIGIILVLLLQVTGRTLTLPASIILLNNCSPHPSVLGTVHGLGQSVSAAFRTVGPIVGGWWYGAGLDIGMVGAGWWGVTAVATLGLVSSIWIYEGSGHEILLEGEESDI